MSEVLEFRIGTAVENSTFIGGLAEIVVDTDNNRAILHDGATPGGHAMAKLSEVMLPTRSSVNDSNYIMQTTDRSIGFTAISGPRNILLAAANLFPTGTPLFIFDESGHGSTINTITLLAHGVDTVEGAASLIINQSFGFRVLQSDGVSKWTVLGRSTGSMSQQDATAVAITGGAIDGVTIGGISPPNITAATVIIKTTLTENTNNAAAAYAMNRTVLNPALTNYAAQIVGQVNGVSHWVIVPGDGTQMTGGNVGDNFAIARFNDSGAFLDEPITINRATGQVSIMNGAVAALSVGAVVTPTATASPSMITMDETYSSIAGANPKIVLFPGFGLGVSAGELDIIASNGCVTAFWAGTQKVFAFDGTGNVSVCGASSGSTTITAATNASGAWTLPSTTDQFVGRSTTDTLTNKRVNPRIATLASASTITPTSDVADQFNVTALAAAASVAIPTGTPVDGQLFTLRIKDNGTARALSWVTTAGGYRAIGISLPTTTVISTPLYVTFAYNAQDSFWDVIFVS